MKIKTNAEYKNALHKVYRFMNNGEENITDAQAKQAEKLAKAVEGYEDNVLKIMPLQATNNSVVGKSLSRWTEL